MNRNSVNSSMIASVGYDVATGTLEIEFKNGGAVWQYFDVPEHIGHGFESNASLGQYFLANIKNQYRESRVG